MITEIFKNMNKNGTEKHKKDVLVYVLVYDILPSLNILLR